MITYNTLEELKKDVVDDTLCVRDDVTITFDMHYPTLKLNVYNLTCKHLDVAEVKAWHIEATSINTSFLRADDCFLEGHLEFCNIDIENYLDVAGYVFQKKGE